MLKLNAHVLHVSRYDFKDDSGKNIKGCTVHVLDGSIDNTDDARGTKPMKLQGAFDAFRDFEALPGDYELDCTLGSGSKPKIQGAKLREPKQSVPVKIA